MSTKKKLSFRDIERILEQNGWAEVNDDSLDYRSFDMELVSRDQEVTVRAWLSMDDNGISAFMHYGIVSLEVSNYPGGFPLGYLAMTDMIYAMELAEDNLLAIGVPFAKDCYFSGRNAANKRRRNRALRKKFNLREDEILSYRRKLAGLHRTPEEIEAAIAEDYPEE